MFELYEIAISIYFKTLQIWIQLNKIMFVILFTVAFGQEWINITCTLCQQTHNLTVKLDTIDKTTTQNFNKNIKLLEKRESKNGYCFVLCMIRMLTGVLFNNKIHVELHLLHTCIVHIFPSCMHVHVWVCIFFNLSS